MEQQEDGERATWVKDGRPLQVGKLFGTQIQTPELSEAGLELAYSGHGGLLPLLAWAVLAVKQDLLKHAVGGGVGHLEVQALLGQTQNEKRRPAAPQK